VGRDGDGQPHGQRCLHAPIDAQTQNHQIALDAVESATAGSKRPALKPESGEEAQARLVVAEDEADERLQTEPRRRLDGLASSATADPAAVVAGATYTLTSAVARYAGLP